MHLKNCPLHFLVLSPCRWPSRRGLMRGHKSWEILRRSSLSLGKKETRFKKVPHSSHAELEKISNLETKSCLSSYSIATQMLRLVNIHSEYVLWSFQIFDGNFVVVPNLNVIFTYVQLCAFANSMYIFENY